MSLTPGTKLQDYEIRRPLGAGGMGEVYLAQDTKLGRSVAIKVLSSQVASDGARIRRFEQEARAASALSHPNVCVVHALGETSDGQPYFAMEYIEGQTLRHLLQTRPPTLKAALDMAIQVAAGLGAAHAIGIVHRDLKPENVIVRTDGLVKVLDFGLAKLAPGGLPNDEATRTLVQTDSGVVMGTYTYMAPEQARGQEVDGRADIWALGVMLYELVSGRVPFTGHTPSDVMVAILDRAPAPLDKLNPAIPHELQRIVAKALRKDRAQRYQTIADLRLDLEALRGELQSASQDAAPAAASLPSATTPQPIRRESSAEFILTGLARHRMAAATVLSVSAVLIAGAVWRMRGATSGPSISSATHVQRNLTRLTFGRGLQTDPTLSPDGRFFAYASERAGNFDIWVQPVAGGDAVQITKDPEPETQPAWSPDGSTIAFRSEKGGGGLFAVPALGGPSRRLTTTGERPAWSRDGSEILYQVGPFLNAGEGLLRMYAVAAEGGVPQELAGPVLEHGTWRWIAQHPDGRLSAVGTHETQGVGFYTFSRSGEHLVKSNISSAAALISPNQFGRCRFVWNRDGTRLYFEAPVKVDNLWRIDVDPATLEWRGAERLTTGGGSDIDAVLSADESRLVYVQQSFSRRLWSFPFDAAAGRVIGQGAPFSEDGGDANVSDLSRDGSAAVYELIRPGTDQVDLWLHRFETGSGQLLVQDGHIPVWSSDGRVAFLKWRKRESALMVREADGTERQVSPWRENPILLPSGVPPGSKALLVTALGTEGAPLWLWNLERLNDAPQHVVIDRARMNFWQAKVSPNGRWLAFAAETLGHPEPGKIRIAPMGDASVTEWADVPGLSGVDKPRWAPDGRTLYFLWNRGGFQNLAGIRFDPDRGVTVGEPFEVTHFTSPDLIVTPYLDRTDTGIAAHRAILTMMSSTGSIWMLDNVDK